MNTRILVLVASIPLLLSGCGIISKPVYRSGGISATGSVDGFRERGVASFYGPGFHGNLTANGEIYDMNGMTCAHPSLPFDTILSVTNLDNGREVSVRVNDRGPYVGGRIIDLSRGAAQELDMLESGIANVLLRVIGND